MSAWNNKKFTEDLKDRLSGISPQYIQDYLWQITGNLPAKSTVFGYKNGTVTPSVSTFLALCQMAGLQPMDYISSEEKSDTIDLKLDDIRVGKSPSAIVLLDGDISSHVLLRLIKQQGFRRVHTIYLRHSTYRQKFREYARVQSEEEGADYHHEMNLLSVGGKFDRPARIRKEISKEIRKSLKPPKRGYKPNKNLLMISAAMLYGQVLETPRIYHGGFRKTGVMEWDKTQLFYDRLNDFVRMTSNTPMKVETPFVNYNLREIIRVGIELGVKFTLSRSCTSGYEVPCGKCAACRNRLNAFLDIEAEDPLEYQHNTKSDFVLKYRNKIESLNEAQGQGGLI